jgi:hypothetical protein
MIFQMILLMIPLMILGVRTVHPIMMLGERAVPLMMIFRFKKGQRNFVIW